MLVHAFPEIAMSDGHSQTLARSRSTTSDSGDRVESDENYRLIAGAMVPGTRYRIVRWLGEGGMGQVFEAVHIDIDRPVALKVLQAALALTPELAEHFLCEARACAKVESRFVVDVIGFGELPDHRPFVVMELLGASTLADALELGWMKPERAIPILRQCCKALAAIHAAGLVHRDIKPRNIVLQVEDGRADAVRVVDFGLVVESGASPRLAGTASYMAPEQIRGQRVDRRTDIYALGCTAYQMLSGRPPFRGNLDERFAGHLQQPPPPLSRVCPTQPAGLEPILLRCLEKQPDCRWATADELEAALIEFQIASGFVTAWDDLPMPMVDEPRRARMLAQMPRGNRHPRWLMPSALALALVIGAVAGGALTDDTPAPYDADPVVTLDERAHTRIDELTDATRLAASKANWIYPVGDEADPTALQWIRVLESEANLAGAGERASLLRHELAETLMRLGDHFWSEQHGRGFALEFYAMAQVFVPDLELPEERRALTSVQLTDLITRAEQRRFDPAELRTARVMALLSDGDPDRRRARLQQMLSASDQQLPTHLQEQLTAVVDSHAEPQQRARPAAESERASDASDQGLRDHVRAATLVERGRAAAARGDRARARRVFEQALERDEHAIAALHGLAELYFDAGEYARALGYARRASSLAPNDAELSILLGDCYLKTMRYASAVEAYRHAQKLGDPHAAGRLAKLADARG